MSGPSCSTTQHAGSPDPYFAVSALHASHARSASTSSAGYPVRPSHSLQTDRIIHKCSRSSHRSSCSERSALVGAWTITHDPPELSWLLPSSKSDHLALGSGGHGLVCAGMPSSHARTTWRPGTWYGWPPVASPTIPMHRCSPQPVGRCRLRHPWCRPSKLLANSADSLP